MTGLILKDLLLVKAQSQIYLLILGVYLVLTAIGSFGISFFSSFVVLLLSLLPVSTFSLDANARWDKYAASLPAGRRGVVRSKYLFVLCLVGIALVLVTVADVVLCLIRGELASLPALLLTAPICALLGLVMNCIIMPLSFKFDPEKSRVAITVCNIALFFLLFTGINVLAESGFSTSEFFSRLPSWLPYLLPVLGVALVALILLASYRLSLHFYSKKEL